MSNPKTGPVCSKCLSLCALLLLAGCAKTQSEQPAPRSIWTPDPGLLHCMTHSGFAGKYMVWLPMNYKADAPKRNVQRTKQGTEIVMDIGTWKAKSGPGESPPFVTAWINSDPRLIKEIQKNTWQALLDSSAGLAGAMSITIDSRGSIEIGDLGAIRFVRCKWHGTTKDQVPVIGLAYGALDDWTESAQVRTTGKDTSHDIVLEKTNAILIHGLSFGVNAETDNQMNETIIATFKRRQ